MEGGAGGLVLDLSCISHTRIKETACVCVCACACVFFFLLSNPPIGCRRTFTIMHPLIGPSLIQPGLNPAWICGALIPSERSSPPSLGGMDRVLGTSVKITQLTIQSCASVAEWTGQTRLLARPRLQTPRFRRA